MKTAQGRESRPSRASMAPGSPGPVYDAGRAGGHGRREELVCKGAGRAARVACKRRAAAAKRPGAATPPVQGGRALSATPRPPLPWVVS